SDPALRRSLFLPPLKPAKPWPDGYICQFASRRSRLNFLWAEARLAWPQSSSFASRALILARNIYNPDSFTGERRQTVSLEEKIYDERREKLKKIEALGQQSYPYKFEATHTIPQVLAGYFEKT